MKFLPSGDALSTRPLPRCVRGSTAKLKRLFMIADDELESAMRNLRKKEGGDGFRFRNRSLPPPAFCRRWAEANEVLGRRLSGPAGEGVR